MGRGILALTNEQLDAMPPVHHRVERDAKDYAIEFGEYLAKSAEQFREFVNIHGTIPDSERDAMTDHWSGLTGAIYEFRKRAAKAAAQKP